MATRALNFQMEEAKIQDMKDAFYRLTAHVQEASAEESAEILKEIDQLTDDDLSLVSSERFAL